MKKAQLPVSRKFYNDISNRINSALSAAPASAAEAMRIVDGYMDGKAPVSADAMAMLAFNMVKSEIDKAIARSTRARQRAKMRKEGKEKPTLPDFGPKPSVEDLVTYVLTGKMPEKKDDSDSDSDLTPPRPLNRRERRAAERLKRRRQKSLRKHSRPST